MPSRQPVTVICDPHTADYSFSVAHSLLELAKITPQAKFLPACAVVIAGAALSQHVDGRARLSAHLKAGISDVPPHRTRQWRVLDARAKESVFDLVRALSDDTLELDRSSRVARSLVRVLGLRNSLLHLEHEPASVPLLIDEDESGKITVTVFPDTLPGQVDPWLQVPLDEAAALIADVKTFIDVTCEAAEPGTLPEAPFFRRGGR